jgi:hypothetical protein
MISLPRVAPFLFTLLFAPLVHGAPASPIVLGFERLRGQPGEEWKTEGGAVLLSELS